MLQQDGQVVARGPLVVSNVEVFGNEVADAEEWDEEIKRL